MALAARQSPPPPSPPAIINGAHLIAVKSQPVCRQLPTASPLRGIIITECIPCLRTMLRASHFQLVRLFFKFAATKHTDCACKLIRWPALAKPVANSPRINLQSRKCKVQIELLCRLLLACLHPRTSERFCHLNGTVNCQLR